jgi:hypothetical protein
VAIDLDALLEAFRTRLATVAGAPNVAHRASENVEYSPVVDEPWYRETLLPDDEDLSSIATLENTGELRYDFFYPIGSGVTTARAVPKLVVEAFAAGQALQNGGLHISLEHTRRHNGRIDSEAGVNIWYHVPVVIYWRAFTAA